MMVELKKQLESIQDLVLVDDKIVTFKLVSKVLKVHTNTAKQLLFAFVQSPDFSEKVAATFLIGGEKEKGGLKYLLVKSDEIEKAKKQFETVLTEHVFSVQRNSALTGADLYNADVSYEISKDDRKFSSIHANNDIVVRDVPNFIPLSKTEEATASKAKSTKNEPLRPVQEKESKSDDKKASPVKEASKKASPKKANKKTAPVKGGGFGALFSRQAANVKHKETKEKEFKENIDVKEEKTEIKEKAEPEAKKKKVESKKKRKKNKESDSKKRKRIKIASDSESSSEEMDYEEEAPPTPEQEVPALASDSDDEVIPPTPEVSRKRVRKQIDKNYVDDEGFLHTKKEFVYESCSDDEAKKAKEEKSDTVKPKEKSLDEDMKKLSTDDKAKKTEQKSPKKTNEKSPDGKKKPGRPKAKAASPQKSKQRPITSFFQKK